MWNLHGFVGTDESYWGRRLYLGEGVLFLNVFEGPNVAVHDEWFKYG